MLSSDNVRRSGEVTLVLVLFFVISCWFTWPAISDPGGYLLRGDPYLNTWILDYVGGQLPADPLRLFNAPFYYPHQHTLAYSENLIGLQPFFLPLRFLTGSPVAAYNLIVLLSFFFNAVGIYLLCRFRIRLSPSAAFFAGVVFAFVHYRMDQIGHLHILWTIWLPAGLWLLYETITRNRWLPAAGLAAVYVLQSYASMHMMLYMAMMLIIFALFMLPMRRQSLAPFGKLAAAGAVSIVVIIPLLLPYLHLRDEYGLERSVEQIAGYSAQVQQLLAPSFFSSFPYPDFILSFSHPEKTLFIGLMALVAVIIGIVAIMRRTPKETSAISRRAPRVVIGIATMAIVAAIATAGLFPDTMTMVKSVMDTTFLFVITPLLILALLWWRNRNVLPQDRWGIAALALTIVGIAFALGPQITMNNESLGIGPYSIMLNLPLASGFRVTARWFNMALPGLAILAAIGLQRILAIRKRRFALVLSLAFPLLALWEYAPLRNYALPRLVDTDLPVYRALAEYPAATTVLELPLAEPIYDETIYMLAQRRHGKAIVNGYSGFSSTQFDRLYAFRNLLRMPDGIPLLRSVPCTMIVVHLDKLDIADRKRWLGWAEKPDASVLHRQMTGEALLFSLRWGGNGTHYAAFAPPEKSSLSCAIRGEGLAADLRHFADVAIDGKNVREVLLTTESQNFELDFADADSDRLPHEITVDYRYQLPEPEPLADALVPFRLHLETGGSDPNHCVVGINGRYWPREKGINVYHLDPAGMVLEWKNFNTAWYAEAGDTLADWLARPIREGDYLVLVTRHQALRAMNENGRAALVGIGIAAARSLPTDAGIMAVVRIGIRKPLLQMTGSGEKLQFMSPQFAVPTGFDFSYR